MTQARAAARVSKSASEAITTADSCYSEPTTEQLKCQQIGCGGTEELAGSVGKQTLGAGGGSDSESSSSSSNSGGSSPASSKSEEDSPAKTSSDDWIQKFLKEYEKVSRFSVTNFSRDSEGFDFPEESAEENEAASEYVQAAPGILKKESEDLEKENGGVQADGTEVAGEGLKEQQQPVVDVSVSHDLPDSIPCLLDTETNEEFKSGSINQQCEDKENAEQVCVTDVLQNSQSQIEVEFFQETSELVSNCNQCQDSSNIQKAIELGQTKSEDSEDNFVTNKLENSILSTPLKNSSLLSPLESSPSLSSQVENSSLSTPLETSSLLTPIESSSLSLPLENSSLPNLLENSPLPNLLENSSLSTPLENSSLSTPLENSSLSTPLENSSLSTPLENSSLSTPLENSSLSTPLENSSLSTPLENSSLSTPLENSSLSTSQKNASLSNPQSCIHLNDTSGSSQQCSNSELNYSGTNTLSQGSLDDVKSTESGLGSMTCQTGTVLPHLYQVGSDDSKSDVECEQSESVANKKRQDSAKLLPNSHEQELEKTHCHLTDTSEIVQYSESNAPLSAGVTEDAPSCVSPYEMKTKVESVQYPLNSTYVVANKTSNRVRQEPMFEQATSSCTDAIDKNHNSSNGRCQDQCKCEEPFLNCYCQSNDNSKKIVLCRQSERDELDKQSIRGGENVTFHPNNSIGLVEQTKTVPSQRFDGALQSENEGKIHSDKCEYEADSYIKPYENGAKFNETFIYSTCEKSRLTQGLQEQVINFPNSGVNRSNACDETKIVSTMKEPSTGSKYLRNCTLPEEKQKTDGVQCRDNDRSNFVGVTKPLSGVELECTKGCTQDISRRSASPTKYSDVKKKSDLLREQFFANNVHKKSDEPFSDLQRVQNLSTGNKKDPFGCQVSCAVDDFGTSQVEAIKKGQDPYTEKSAFSSAPCTRVRNRAGYLTHDSSATNPRHSDNMSQKSIPTRSLTEQQKRSQQHPSSKDKSSKRLQPSSRSHREGLLARVTHKQASAKHSPPPLVLLNGAAVDLQEKSVKPNDAADTLRMNSQLFREVHELFSGFSTSTTDAKSEPICPEGKAQVEMPCHSSPRLRQHKMFGKEQNGSQSSSECATPTNDDPWILSVSDNEVIKASCKVNCKICRKPYNDPRVLPCLHTFCANCLDQCESYVSSVSDVDINGGPDEVGPSNKVQNSRRSRTLSPSPDKSVCLQNNSSSSRSPTKFHRSTIHHISIAASSESSTLSTSSSSSTNSSNSERKRTILCPMCDAEVDLPGQGAHFLPVNYIAKKQLLDSMGERITENLGCDLCSSDSDTSSMHCKDCRINMCSFCSEAHRRQKKTSSHHIVSIQEAKNQGTTNKSSVILCPYHPLEELKLFCETCLQTLCRDCVIMCHRDHVCHFISEVSDQQAAVLKALLGQLKPRTIVLKEMVENLQLNSKKVDIQAEHAWEQVNMFVDNYIQALQLHRKSLLSQIRKIKNQKQERMTLHRIQVEQALEDLESSVSFASQLLQLGSDVEFLTLLGPVLQRLRDLGDVNLKSDIENNEAITFNPFDKAGTVQGFPVLGTVSAKQAISSQCIVKGDGLLTARQGQRSDVFLITRYPDGSLKKNGGENVQAEMISKDTPSKSIPVDVVDCQDGSYLITFCSDTTGLFLLHVTLEGKPVQGSPFVIPVKPKLRQHSGAFHCCSFCSSSGSKEALCACGGTMPGGYKGCGHGHSSHPGSKHWSCCGKTVEKSDCSRPTSATYQFTL